MTGFNAPLQQAAKESARAVYHAAKAGWGAVKGGREDCGETGCTCARREELSGAFASSRFHVTG